MDDVMMDQGMTGANWLWMILTAAVLVIPFWKICRKAGFPGPLSLLILIPLVNLAFIYFLAFANWPGPRNEIR